MQSQYSYAAIMLVAGFGIPIMAAMNATLGARIGSPAAASAVLFFVGGVASLFAFFFTPLGGRAAFGEGPPLYYAAGLLTAFYILSISWIAPRFGVGNAVFFVLLGQLIIAATIDHFGWLGAPRVPVSAQRIAGLVFMAVGVFLARRPPIS